MWWHALMHLCQSKQQCVFFTSDRRVAMWSKFSEAFITFLVGNITSWLSWTSSPFLPSSSFFLLHEYGLLLSFRFIQNYTPHVWTLVTWCPMGSIVLDFLDFLDRFVFFCCLMVFYFLYGALSKESQNIVFFFAVFFCIFHVFFWVSLNLLTCILKKCVLPRFWSYVVQNIL